MESAQEALITISMPATALRFNPCCNGKCSGRVTLPPSGTLIGKVSILVVMESAQEVPLHFHQRPDRQVSILVVMESAQEAVSRRYSFSSHVCFNPCCNGKCSGSRRAGSNPARGPQSFNPCCNGKCSGSGAFIFIEKTTHPVSILVVMESAQEVIVRVGGGG